MPIRSGADTGLMPPPGLAAAAPLPCRARKAADVAHRLPQPMPVLDQRQADIALAILAEADAGSHGDLGLLEQQLGEAQRAQGAERLRHRRPAEHGGRRAGHLPAGLGQPVDQHVAPGAVELAEAVDAVLRPVQRGGGRHLDRREGAIVEVGLDPGQRADRAARCRRRSRSASPAWNRSWTASRTRSRPRRRPAPRGSRAAARRRNRSRHRRCRTGARSRAAAPRPRPPCRSRARRSGRSGSTGSSGPPCVGVGTECSAARASSRIRSIRGPNGTWRIEAPAMMKPKGWIG